MLTNSAINQALVITSTSDHRELNRLLTAAVINKSFCHLLLNNPTKAAHDGFADEAFVLSEQEMALLRSIRASSLAEFARQLGEKLRASTLNTPPVQAIQER